jgi:hypothetical protein
MAVALQHSIVAVTNNRDDIIESNKLNIKNFKIHTNQYKKNQHKNRQ